VPQDLSAKWLEPYAWEEIVLLNARLCEAKAALHQPTSDGYTPARELWERSRPLARGMIRPILERLTVDSDGLRAAAFRAVVGHFVAGTEGLEELRAALREATR